jgi:hypothetical protein
MVRMGLTTLRNANTEFKNYVQTCAGVLRCVAWASFAPHPPHQVRGDHGSSRRGLMQHARQQRRAQKDYYARNGVQRCVVCGRLFVRRRDNVCSIACAQKFGAQKANGPR